MKLLLKLPFVLKGNLRVLGVIHAIVTIEELPTGGDGAESVHLGNAQIIFILMERDEDEPDFCDIMLYGWSSSGILSCVSKFLYFTAICLAMLILSINCTFSFLVELSFSFFGIEILKTVHSKITYSKV